MFLTFDPEQTVSVFLNVLYNHICSKKASFLYSIRNMSNKHPLCYEKESKIISLHQHTIFAKCNLMYRLKLADEIQCVEYGIDIKKMRFL